LAAALLRSTGWTEDEAECFFNAVLAAAGDDGPNGRHRSW
jgi:hypothetical protein